MDHGKLVNSSILDPGLGGSYMQMYRSSGVPRLMTQLHDTFWILDQYIQDLESPTQGDAG